MSMPKDYFSLTEEEQFKYWESLVANKIRVQVEAGGDSLAFVTKDFYRECLKQDLFFSRFFPKLNKQFGEFVKKMNQYQQKSSYDKGKTVILTFAAVVFFGSQILMLYINILDGLKFIGIVDGFIGTIYGIGVFFDQKSKKLYESLAQEKGLLFQCGKSGLPGFLYWPLIEGDYQGFATRLSLNQKWTGRMQGGLFQLTTGTLLELTLPKALTAAEQKTAQTFLEQARTNKISQCSAEPTTFMYKSTGTINKEKKKKEFSEMYDKLVEIAKKFS